MDENNKNEIIDSEKKEKNEEEEKKNEEKQNVEKNAQLECEYIKNQDLYIKLNENESETQDITNDMQNILNSLKLGEIIQSEDFKFLDTMSAIELNHYKMDPHFENEKVENCKVKIEKKIVKEMKDLNLEETFILIDELFKREITWIHGGPVSQNIFELIYFSHEDINKVSNKINPCVFEVYLDSIIQIIYLVYNSLYNCCCFREEDVNIAFYQNAQNIERKDIFNDIKYIEKYLHEQSNTDNKKKISQILNRFHIQKIIITLLSEQFDKNNLSRFENLIVHVNELKNEINLIDFTLSNELKSQNLIDLNIYFDKNLHKIFPLLGSHKVGIIFDEKKTIIKIQEFIDSLTLICNIYQQTNIYHIIHYLQKINQNSPSYIIREILDINLFPNNNNLIFGKIDYKEILIENLKGIKINLTQNEDSDLIDYIISSHKELCKVELKNKARKIREGKDLMDTLTAVTIEGHKKENEKSKNSKGNQNSLINFLLINDLKTMLNLILTNFSIEMFKIDECDYIFFVCETIVNYLSMHSYILISKFAEKLLKEDNIANSQLKKKMSQFQKMLIDESYIFNALKNTFNGLKGLMFYLKKNNLIKFPNLNEKEKILRINNRFTYFKNCGMFINLSYENFENNYNSEIENEDFFNIANESIKSATKYLSELKNAEIKLRETLLFDNDYLNNLSKAIISNSLLFGKIRKFVANEENKGKFLNIIINMKKYDTFLPILEIKS